MSASTMPLVRVAHLHDLLVPSDYAQNEQHHAAIEIQPPPVPRRKASNERAWPSTWPSGVEASADQTMRREGHRAPEQARLRGGAAAEGQAATDEPWSLAAVRVTRELPALRGQPTRRAASAGVSLSRMATGSLRLQECSREDRSKF